MPGGPENMEAAVGSRADGTGTASLQLHRAAVSAIRGLVAVASVSLATMSRYEDVNVLIVSIFCALLVGVVDTATGEILSVEEKQSFWRKVLHATEILLAYLVGGVIPALAALAPSGRLAKLMGICTLALAAFGTATAASCRARAVLLSSVQYLLTGSAGIALCYLILNQVSKIFAAAGK